MKKFGEVYNEGILKFYNPENKKYCVVYENSEEEDLTQSMIRNNLKRKRRSKKRTRNITSLLGQRNLYDKVLSLKDSEAFGDEFPKSSDVNCSIITYQNIGQQPRQRYDKKAIDTSKAFKRSKTSIALYTELSICEEKIPPNEKFNDQMQQYNPRSFSIVSCNQNLMDETPWNFVGGTAITIDKGFLAHKVTDGTGKDPEKFGRWTWSRLQGKDQIHTRFISAYRPYQNTGISTTWTQHLNHFRLPGINCTNPRDKFDKNLCADIEVWKELGDIIIIGIDMNENAYNEKLSRIFRRLVLRPLIKSTHPNQSPPATFDAN